MTDLLRRLARWLRPHPSRPAGQAVPCDMIVTGDVLADGGEVILVLKRKASVQIRTRAGNLVTVRYGESVRVTERMPF